MLPRILSIAWVGVASLLPAGDNPKPEGPGLRLISATVDEDRRVTIQLKAFSGQRTILVPSCGEHDSEFPCVVELQIKIPQGWRLVQPKYGKLGMIPPGQWHAHALLPGTGSDFVYRFIRDEWQVNRGDRVRVVILAWHDEQSMKSMRNTISLKTRTFACP